MAPQGAVCILEPGLHPSCALIVWLAAVLAIQFVGYAGLLAIVATVLILAPAMVGRWFGYVRRARWLLLTLWLILAYNTPGEAFRDLAWAPTYEGIAEANLQAARLVAMLACLAWLFARLGREGMVGGLWGLLQPFRQAGLDIERLVVRLSLVLDNLQTPQAKGAWRQMLASGAPGVGGPALLHLEVLPWSARDTLVVAAACAGLFGAVWL